LACMTWDPTVAAYIAFRILRPAKATSAAAADKRDQRSWPVSDPRPWPIHASSLLDPERPSMYVWYRVPRVEKRPLAGMPTVGRPGRDSRLCTPDHGDCNSLPIS